MSRPASSRLSAAALLAVLAGLPEPFGFGHAAAAPADAARTLLLESRQRNETQAEEYRGELIVTASNGKVRRKEWKSYRQGSAGNTDRLIRFLSPPEVRGVAYLAKQRVGKPSDEWLYLPSMKRERRIAARDRDAAFVGTDFNYEDLDLVEFDDSRYDVAQLPDQTCDSHPCYVIELVSRGESVYERKILALRKDTLAFTGVDFFLKGDRAPSKRLTLSGYEMLEGRQVPTRIEMADLRKGSHTVIRLHDVVVNGPQPRDRYTIQNLLREDVDEAAFLVGAPAPWASATRAMTGAASEPPAGRFSHTFTGYVEGKWFADVAENRQPEAGSTGWGTVFARDSLRVGPVRLAAAVRLEQSSSSQVGPAIFDPADRALRRSAVTLRELSITIPMMSGIDLQAGRFKLAWGQTDGYSPADAFLPRDLTDPLTEDVLPLWAIRVRGERGGVRFDALVTPVTTPWRLPTLDGREISSAGVYLVDVGPTSAMPRRGFGAFRVGGSVARWDVGFWARSGIRPAPVLESGPLEPQSDGTYVVRVGRHFTSERAVGMQVAREYAGWVFRGELGVIRSPDQILGNAVILTVGSSREVRQGTFTATFAANATGTGVSPLLLFDRALLPAIIIAADEFESWGRWKVGWLATVDKVGGVLTAEATKNLTEVVALTAGADLPHGAELSPATAFTAGKRLRLAIRWAW